MRTLLYVFLLSTSIFAQQEEQLASKLRTVLETEEQFLAPLNQTLSAVAEENGYAIDESYTYVDLTEAYDYFFKTEFNKKNLAQKIVIGSVSVGLPTALTVGGLLKKNFLAMASGLLAVSLFSLPPILDATYMENLITIAPNCPGHLLVSKCVASRSKMRTSSYYYVSELHYKLASSGFTGSCFIWMTPDNYPASTKAGYRFAPIDPLTPFLESEKLDYEITNCTHKGVFPGQNDVVATGSILRESL